MAMDVLTNVVAIMVRVACIEGVMHLINDSACLCQFLADYCTNLYPIYYQLSVVDSITDQIGSKERNLDFYLVKRNIGKADKRHSYLWISIG